MKKLLLIILVSCGLVQAADKFESVKQQLTNCTGLSYEGNELHAIFKDAAFLINENKCQDELIKLISKQICNNNILKNKRNVQEKLLENFLSNIDTSKKNSIINKLRDTITNRELINFLEKNTTEEKGNREGYNQLFNSFAAEDFKAKKTLWNIIYGGGLIVFGSSCLKKSDIIDVGITSFCLTGLFFNNKKTTGRLNEQMKQANKNWKDQLYCAGLTTAFWSCYQKPSKTNIGLAGLCLAGLYYNNKK